MSKFKRISEEEHGLMVMFTDKTKCEEVRKHYERLPNCHCDRIPEWERENQLLKTKLEKIIKYAKSMTECTHSLCSISEALNEERIGEEILDLINKEEQQTSNK